LIACGCAKLKNVTSRRDDVAPQRQARNEQAVTSFERRRDDAQYRAGLASWARGDTHDCEVQLVELLKRNPDHFEARLALADLYLEQQDARAAEQEYRELIERHPQQAQAHQSLGLFLELAGRTDEAFEHFARAAEIEPNNPRYAALASPAANAANLAAAGSVQAATLATGPDSPNRAIVAAANLLQAGQPEAALRLAATASEKDPGNVRLKHAVAAAQFELGDLETAQVTLQQALSLDNRNALTYFLLGCTLAARGQRETAEGHFAQACKLDPRLASRRKRVPPAMR
jgi:Flp pilus assembly protein TadD